MGYTIQSLGGAAADWQPRAFVSQKFQIEECRVLGASGGRGCRCGGRWVYRHNWNFCHRECHVRSSASRERFGCTVRPTLTSAFGNTCGHSAVTVSSALECTLEAWRSYRQLLSVRGFSHHSATLVLNPLLTQR